MAARYGGLCAGARKLNSSMARITSSFTSRAPVSGPAWTALKPTTPRSPGPSSGFPGPVRSARHLLYGSRVIREHASRLPDPLRRPARQHLPQRHFEEPVLKRSASDICSQNLHTIFQVTAIISGNIYQHQS